MPSDALTLCHECDLLQRNPPLPPGGSAQCVRCGCRLHKHRPDSLNRTLALALAGIVLFAIANSFPFLSFQMQGQTTQTTLFTGVQDLTEQGKGEVAAVVFFTSILAPGLQLALLLAVLLPLRLGGRLPPGYPTLFRWFKTLVPWGMMDVFMIGILVSVVKLTDMATIVPGPALFSFVVLIFVLAAAQAALDPDIVWARVPLPPALRRRPDPSQPVLGCDVCELVVPVQQASRDRRGHVRCPRCNDRLHRRKPRSLQRTWALVIAALVLYIPANLYPVMSVTSLGRTQSDTIFSGVVFLLNHDMWPLAAIVFVASIFVPLLKLLILMFLLVSVQTGSRWRPRDRTRLYRITEAIGRWSMVDIYVVTILVALVRLGNLASIQAEAGAVFFCAVVILTMLAAMTFDPRLIWDALERDRERDRGRDRGRETARDTGVRPGVVADAGRIEPTGASA
ncbi:paraquat-inducible protein A [Thiohalocapsa marina]|uniref:Paraquat-inducible protein A n=1 Tax=Thiohalocapsa marina TaxID=424902 RepID=A0A5M8FT66_9GAMM|nr:paraquat-inducible protein A [Thiohalocapsa marina]KAA6186988.1 paraquat-inducible protein A [Thiohalocapsa marina]